MGSLEETPELGLGNHRNIEATGWIKPVITKEEKNPGKEGDTREDEGSRNTYQAAPCLRYQAKKEEEPKYQAGELHSEDAKLRTFQTKDQVSQSRLTKLLSNLSWDNEDGGIEEDDAKFLELIGDQAKDQVPQDWLEKLLSNLDWYGEHGRLKLRSNLQAVKGNLESLKKGNQDYRSRDTFLSEWSKNTPFLRCFDLKTLQIRGVTFKIAKSNLQSQRPPPSPLGKNAVSAALMYRQMYGFRYRQLYAYG